MRLFFFFLLAGYSYLFAGNSPLYAQKSYTASSWGEGLKNRVLFTWAFLEMMTWFWVFVTLREERAERARVLQAKAAAESDML